MNFGKGSIFFDSVIAFNTVSKYLYHQNERYHLLDKCQHLRHRVTFRKMAILQRTQLKKVLISIDFE